MRLDQLCGAISFRQLARVESSRWAEHRGLPCRHPGRCAHAAQHALAAYHMRTAHQDGAVTPFWGARTISAVDGAPGSWWPTERSPRYEARPFRACMGIVA